MPTVLKIILYPLFAVFCLALFLVILFPFDSVKNRLAREIERRMGGDYSISIGHLSPTSLSGVVLKDVEVRPRGETETVLVKLSRARMQVAPLSLLAGGVEVDFDLRADKGRAEGSLSWKRSGMTLALEMKEFDLSVAGFLARKAGVPITGRVSGTVEMEVFPQDPLRNTGKVLLEMPELKLGEVQGLRLPPIQLAKAGGPLSKIDLLISKGNVEVRSIQFSGGDLDFNAAGKIYGARKMDNYRFNLQGSFKVLETLASQIPLLMVVEKQKAADGTYPFTMTGRVSKPNIRIGEFKVPSLDEFGQ